MFNVLPVGLQTAVEREGEVLVEEGSSRRLAHGGRQMRGHVCRVPKRGSNLVNRQLVLARDGLDRLPCGYQSDHSGDVDPGAAMHGLPNRTSGFMVMPGKTSIGPATLFRR